VTQNVAMQEFVPTQRRLACTLALVALAAGVVTACAFASMSLAASPQSDPPVLVPWHQIGRIGLGEPLRNVERSYGTVGHGYHVDARTGDYVQGHYTLHGSNVDVAFSSGRVSEIGFQTPYYRTRSGFGVGSKVPLGPCYKTATSPCEHRWHGFVYNAWNRDKPCECWVKVGLAPQSLAASPANFLKPWFFIDMRHGRVSRFYFASKFVD
jgi:hypothetical protein